MKQLSYLQGALVALFGICVAISIARTVSWLIDRSPKPYHFTNEDAKRINDLDVALNKDGFYEMAFKGELNKPGLPSHPVEKTNFGFTASYRDTNDQWSEPSWPPRGYVSVYFQASSTNKYELKYVNTGGTNKITFHNPLVLRFSIPGERYAAVPCMVLLTKDELLSLTNCGWEIDTNVSDVVFMQVDNR